MLGYDSFAEVSLVPKMADTPAQVMAFLRDWRQRRKPFAERDLAELRDFARNELGLDPGTLGHGLGLGKAQAAALQLLRRRSEAVLPEPKVLEGLFRVIEGCSASPSSPTRRRSGTPTCASSASSAPARADRPVLPRPLRPRHQARRRLDGRAITRRRISAGIVQTPVAYLNCNFPAPVGEKDGKQGRPPSATTT
jgi:oligopeptidase A